MSMEREAYAATIVRALIEITAAVAAAFAAKKRSRLTRRRRMP